MDRLTERDEYGNADIIGVDSQDLQLNLDFDELNRVTRALNKLAEYEDIGSVAQFAEWAQAEKEGRSIANGFAITNKDGTRIDYAELGTKYKDQLVYCDIDGFYIGEDGQLVLMDDCGNSVCVDSDDYRITANFEAAKGE